MGELNVEAKFILRLLKYTIGDVGNWYIVKIRDIKKNG